MKAVIYTSYGGPEVLQITELPKPVPKENEVLIRIHAVSINDWDMANLLGLPKFGRIFGGLKEPKQPILCSDISGIVEAVGKNITRFQAGDAVYGDASGRWGGLAEYGCFLEKHLVNKPAGMNFIDAAAIPQAGMLALQGLRDAGMIRNGQKILINGAGGGVGTIGLQIARQYDVELTGVDHTCKQDFMRSLGFDHVIDYTKEDFTKQDKKYDLVLDAKTNRPIRAYFRVLKEHGQYITVGGDLGRLLVNFLLKLFIPVLSKKRYKLVMLKQNSDLEYFNQLYATGKFKPVIDGPYTLDQTVEAFQKFVDGRHLGKIVITTPNEALPNSA